MKIGILGGTFNPIHNGHISLGEQFLKHLSLDKIILVPTNIPPHKNSYELAKSENRLDMCKLAVEDIEKFSVADIEIMREGKSFTIETMRQLKNIYPDDDLYLIVGSDMFFSFTTWKNYEEILKLAVLCTAGRKATEYEKLIEHRNHFDKAENIEVLDIDVTDISSSEIRELIKDNKPFESYLPYKICEYIKQNNLYLYNKPYQYDLPFIMDKLKELLSPNRLNHSLCVTRRAVMLAKIHDEDEQKSVVAGLLHDIQKDVSTDMMLQRIKNSDIIFGNTFLRQKSVWHSMAGYIYIKNELNIQNIDILNAVRYHTTARKGMSKLEKIIYLADKTSDDRTYDGIDMMKEKADKSLDEAMREALQFIICDLSKTGSIINCDTIDAYNEFISPSGSI